MAIFQAGQIESPFPSMNDLLAPRQMALREGLAADEHRNSLLNQEQTRQQMGAVDTEYVARAAQSLLTLGDDASIAAAYPEVVRSLQSKGLAMNAPAQSPGRTALERIAALGTPSAKLGEMQAVRGAAGIVRDSLGPQSSAAPAGSATEVPPALLPFYKEASAETGIPAEVLIAQHRQESGFNPMARGAAGEIGLGQIKPSTAREPGFGMTGVDPATLDDPRNNILFSARYLKARSQGADFADPAQRDKALVAYNGGGDPNYVANVGRYLPSRVAARTGGVDVAGPGGAPVGGGEKTAQAAAPNMPAQLRTLDNGLTQSDVAEFNRRAAAVRTMDQLQAVQNDIEQRKTFNLSRQDKWQSQQRQSQADARAEEEAARKRADAADPIQGNSDKAHADRALYKYADKIVDGTATTEERRLYAQGAQHYLKPTLQWTAVDPNDPTKGQQLVPAQGQLPEGFPHPNFKPGQQSAPAPAAVKIDFKPLPDAERKLLLDTAGRLDQVGRQIDTFKPDFAGFGNAALGDLANTAARNLPASKTAQDRAQWWADYQRYKLAVRQGISGQSLTATELSEFDKADINPGMTSDVIKRNLAQQGTVLRTVHERRIGSLAADRYSPDAIKAASGIDPATVKEHPIGSQAPTPDKPALPPGWKEIIP